MQLLSDGVRDLAFLGDDKLIELSLQGTLSNVSVVDTVPLDCSMIFAGPENDKNLLDQVASGETLQVATSYPWLLADTLGGQFKNLRAVFVSGGCEGYVASGVCDALFDIKSSGDTLAANGLIVYETIRKLNLNVLDACEYDASTVGDRLLAGSRAVTQTLAERFQQVGDLEQDSYTLNLMRSQNERVKKIFSEFGELMQALQRRPTSREEIVSESADLLYSLQVFLACEDLSLVDVLEEDIKRNKTDIEEKKDE